MTPKISLKELDDHTRCYECRCYPCDVTCSMQGKCNVIFENAVEQFLSKKLDEFEKGIDDLRNQVLNKTGIRYYDFNDGIEVGLSKSLQLINKIFKE